MNIIESWDKELRLTLIGRTGNGKSATANSLLNTRGAFKTSICGISCTTKTEYKTRTWSEKNVVVIDTPGLFDTEMKPEEIKKEMVKCVGIMAPGLHALIYVLKIGNRLTDEEVSTIDQLLKIFGEDLHQYVIVVFTCRQALVENKISFQDYLQKTPKRFQELFEKCQNRVLPIENISSTPDTNEAESILNMVLEMSRRRNYPFYSNEMLKLAEREIQKALKNMDTQFDPNAFREECISDGKFLKVLIGGGVGLAVGAMIATITPIVALAGAAIGGFAGAAVGGYLLS